MTKLCLVHVVAVLVAASYASLSRTKESPDVDLSGVITDANSSSLPRARVLLVDLASLQTQAVEVREDGKFAFRDLKPGDYAVIAVGPAWGGGSVCWIPAIRQIRIENRAKDDLRILLLLDNKRCPGIVN
jgi:hypothetical protein